MLVWFANKILYLAIFYAIFRFGVYIGKNGWDDMFD